MAEQIRRFHPAVVAVMREEDVPRLRNLVGSSTPEILSGVEGLIACATHDDLHMVISAIVGVKGVSLSTTMGPGIKVSVKVEDLRKVLALDGAPVTVRNNFV